MEKLPPPAANADVFKHHAPNPDPKDNDATSLAIVAAGTAIQEAWALITKAHAAHMANPMHTADANLKASNDYSEKVVLGLDAKLKPLREAVAAETKALTAKVEAPLKLPSEPGVNYSVTAQHIRDYFAKLSKEQRLTRAMKAAQEGDIVTLGALLNAPGYLSGMDEADAATGNSLQELLRNTFKAIHFKADMARLEKLERCGELIHHGSEAIVSVAVQLHPAEKLKQALALDKAAKEASKYAAQFA